jgi:flagellar FliL protein
MVKPHHSVPHRTARQPVRNTFFMAESKSSSSSPSVLMRILALLAVLSVLALTTVGGAWLYKNKHLDALLGGQSAQAAAAPSAVDPDSLAPNPIFVALDPFTVTLSDEDNERIVRMAITVRLEDPVSQERLSLYKPEVRNRILMVLSSQSPDNITHSETRLKLGQEIAQALSRPFEPLVAGQRIQGILFTEFVVQ